MINSRINAILMDEWGIHAGDYERFTVKREYVNVPVER